MKTFFIITGLALLAVFIFAKCTPKEYIYFYENQENNLGKTTETSFNPNDFRLHCDLGTDSIIKDKEQVTPLFIKLVFIGQHQYYPPNLRFEIFVDNKKIELSDTVSYKITTVVDDHVTYFNDTLISLNIPSMIAKLKKEKNLPDSSNYFSVISSYSRYYINNKTNPQTIQIIVKTIWDNGSAIKEINYTLKKIENKKGDYRLPIRPYG